MSEEDDYRRLEAKGFELRERWRSQYPDAAREIAEMGDVVSPEDLAAWRARHPEAVAGGYFRWVLYSRDGVRKMRMTVPGWEPWEPTEL